MLGGDLVVPHSISIDSYRYRESQTDTRKSRCAQQKNEHIIYLPHEIHENSLKQLAFKINFILKKLNLYSTFQGYICVPLRDYIKFPREENKNIHLQPHSPAFPKQQIP